MTLFPEMVMGVLGQSITGRALQDGKAQVQAHNIRDYTTDKHGHVDDTPYGGGMGMVMRLYQKSGRTRQAEALLAQYQHRMTPAQKVRFSALSSHRDQAKG